MKPADSEAREFFDCTSALCSAQCGGAYRMMESRCERLTALLTRRDAEAREETIAAAVRALDPMKVQCTGEDYKRARTWWGVCKAQIESLRALPGEGGGK
jgi:hypothetical protein